MSLYHDVTTVGATYLGPAAEPFIGRQCTLYLKIQPQALAKEHLPELAKWIEVAGTRFLDAMKAKELATKIAAL